MWKLIIVIIAGLIPLAPAFIYFMTQRRRSPTGASRRLARALLGLDLVIALFVAAGALLWLASPQTVMAAGLSAPSGTTDPYATLAAAIAAGVATIAAGFAVSNTGAAAVGAIAEKPEVFGRALVFVGLAEGIGIYGLIVAVLILNR
jgi:V/A-type H+-transporting ATPase subunit K